MNNKDFNAASSVLNIEEMLRRTGLPIEAIDEEVKGIAPNEKLMMTLRGIDHKKLTREVKYLKESEFSYAKHVQLVGSGKKDDYLRKMSNRFGGVLFDRTGYVFEQNSSAIRTRSIYEDDLSGLRKPVSYELMPYIAEVGLAEKIGVTSHFPEIGQISVVPQPDQEPVAIDLEEGQPAGDPGNPSFINGTEIKPKLLYVKVTLSRRASHLITPLGEAVIKEIINRAFAVAKDNRIFNGTGTNGAPLGLYANTGVVKIDGSSLSAEKIYDMIKRVSVNEADRTKCSFVLNASLEETLRKRPYASNTRMIIEKGLLCDEPYFVSERISNGMLFYGDYSTVVLTTYPRVLLFDPYSSGSAEMDVNLKEWEYYDITTRQPGKVVCAENCD